MNRLFQTTLIFSTVVGSWLGMQAVHELGHAAAAKLTGGHVSQVVLNPLTISRTDLSENPRPLVVVWAGPIVGVVAPLILWGLAAALQFRAAFVLRFFAGFCLIANGFYIGVGSFDGVGDCGEMLRHGSQPWQLWIFGALTAPLGLWLWHDQGSHFGFGPERRAIHKNVAIGCLLATLALIALGLIIGGE